MISREIRYFVPKLINRLSAFKNNIWKYSDVQRASNRGYIGFTDAASLKARLNAILGSYDVTLLKGIDKDEETIIIENANQVLRHEFDFLGSGPVAMEPINWHVDFKSGEKWQKKFYRDIITPQGADIKVPWELSRCQHLLWLGEAYLLTSKAIYAQEIIDEIYWWIKDNPLMYSVNWKCSMDVAFRAVNWIFALNMIAEYEGFDDSFSEAISNSLWNHGFFIYNNLEKTIPYSNNHYVSDVVGLLYIGAIFHHTKKGIKWFRNSLKEYYLETRQQVLMSGVHYERSISYHRLMVELLSYPIYMLQRLGVTVPLDILERIQKMYAFISNYTKNTGLSPLIADNDDGRFLPFLKRDFRDHNYLNDDKSVENRFVSCKDKVIFHSDEQHSELYSDAGFAILRGGDSYLFVCNGGYSKHPKETDIRIGTHTHNDLLSFEYSYKGHDIIIDPGTYLYTSSPILRNEFRSTLRHNTIFVDEEEQNFLHSRYLFLVNRNVHIGQLELIGDILNGSYKTIAGGMYHERSFRVNDGILYIADHISKKGAGHKATLRYNLAENLRYNEDVLIKCSINNIKLIESNWSPSYGILRNSYAIEIQFEFDDSIDVETQIIPLF